MSDPVARLNAALEGRYAIERELGEGGMATVYLAKDLKHERKVALKVLKPELAAVVGAERFLAEITTTANLTHPHILPLFDSGEADSFLFYVMPHIEGESLRERIDREKQLPVAEAVKITTDLAEALDYAHRHKIIHRDIKPANILIHEGRPLIADFGIALAVGVAGGGRLTETGLSVGTPHYMSPEQATGDQAVGVATDIYALGAVLYEMLVGEPPYTGSTAQAILGKIIQGKLASATEERASVPANVDAAIRKALEKLPADRFTGAQEFAGALADPGFRHGEVDEAAVVAGVGPWNRLTVGFATTAVLLAGLAAWGWLSRPPASLPGVPTRAPLTGVERPRPGAGGGWILAISPDGRSILKSAEGAIHMRTASDPEWRQLPNTEGGVNPTFSPDGQSVAFTTAGAGAASGFSGANAGGISKVSTLGGLALPVTTSGSNPHWGFDETIVYNDGGRLYRVGSSGGEPELLLESDSMVVSRPHLLPNGKGVVFGTGNALTSRIMILEIETGEVRELIPSGSQPRYVSTGHLIYGHSGGALMGVAFDIQSLQVTGAPVTLLPSLTVATGGASWFAVSQTGTLVYGTGGTTSGPSSAPVWVQRDGTAREIDSGWSVRGALNRVSLALSPEGDRLAISILGSEGTYDLWVKQLNTGPRGTLSRLTFDGAENIRASWSGDGQSLTFVSNRAGGGGGPAAAPYDLWTKRADGSGTAELVLDQEAPIWEGFFSPDGTWLVFREGGNQLADMYAIRPGVDSVPVPLEVTEFQDRSLSLSPNGRWLAYVSNRSGRDEVYVRPFPDAGGSLQQVSAEGGIEPLWAHSGRELFYRNGANELVAVQVTEDPTFTSGQQQVLFSMAGYLTSNGRPQYDVSPDDQEFAMLRIGDEDATTSAYLVVNWFEELRQRMGN